VDPDDPAVTLWVQLISVTSSHVGLRVKKPRQFLLCFTCNSSLFINYFAFFFGVGDTVLIVAVTVERILAVLFETLVTAVADDDVIGSGEAHAAAADDVTIAAFQFQNSRHFALGRRNDAAAGAGDRVAVGAHQRLVAVTMVTHRRPLIERAGREGGARGGARGVLLARLETMGAQITAPGVRLERAADGAGLHRSAVRS